MKRVSVRSSLSNCFVQRRQIKKDMKLFPPQHSSEIGVYIFAITGGFPGAFKETRSNDVEYLLMSFY
jgi:hypothetical protein